MYFIYLRKNDSLVAAGTSKQCAEVLGVPPHRIHEMASRVKSGKLKKWEIYSEPYAELDTLMPDSFCHRLRIARMEAELTQKELSIRAGVTEYAIWKAENNVKIPDEKALASIAKVLGVTPEYLLEGEE